MNVNKIKALFRSRRFYVALAASAVTFAKNLGMELDQQTIESLVMLAAVWIVGDSLRETD